eukprot:6650983-Pyramimonas_sp.AAC.2
MEGSCANGTVAVTVQWSMSQSQSQVSTSGVPAVLWEVMEQGAASELGELLFTGNATLCVNPCADYTLVAVDPTEEGE